MSLAVLLLLVGLFFLSLELFVPSAGVLFIAATACVLWSVVTAFQVHWTYGIGFLTLDLVLGLILPSVGLRLWSRSPMGRQMFLPAPPPDAEDVGEPAVHPLVGAIGKCLTALRPSGAAEIEGKRTDVIADGGVMILEGAMIKVTSVVGNKVSVRQCHENERESRPAPKRNLIETLDEDFLKE